MAEVGSISSAQWSQQYQWLWDDVWRRALSLCCRDAVGTVRAAAFKALGEVLLQMPSHVCSSLFSMGHHHHDDNGDNADGDGRLSSLLDCIIMGTGDSKLVVRVHAMWTLGNLLHILPTAISSSSSSSSSSCSGWFDERLLDLCDLCLSLLDDSEKLMLSTGRCLGLLAARLRLHDDRHLDMFSGLHCHHR